MDEWQGAILVQKNPDADAAMLLGEADWMEKFYNLTIDMSVKITLENRGILEEINQECDVMIDEYEEEWIHPDKLPVLLDIIIKFKNACDSDLEEREKKFIVGLHKLVTKAIRMGVPLIFAF